jgi:aspartate-semialdehyde dehydrogenase
MKENKTASIALVGATGAVGAELRGALEMSEFKIKNLRLISSEESAGELYEFRGDSLAVESLGEDSFKDIDIAVFAVQEPLSGAFIPQALQAGAFVIDLSGWAGRTKSAPVIVSGVNDDVLSPDLRLVSSAGAVATQVAVPMAALQAAVGIRSAFIAGYLSVSGAGRDALDELWAQSLAVMNQREAQQEIFRNQIAFNCIPQVGAIQESGDTSEEQRVSFELMNVLNNHKLDLNVTLVWVPVFHCHGLVVDLVLENKLPRSRLLDLLGGYPGIVIRDEHDDLPLQRGVVGTADIHIGRIRERGSGCSLWLVGDNLTRGAAMNVIGIIARLLSL